MNKQITNTIPMDLNSSGGDHYAQNHPQRDTTCKQTHYIYYYYLLVLIRTQNLYILLNKCLIFHPFAYSQDYVLVPDNAYLVVRYHLGTTPWSARRTRARLISGVIQATGDLIDIFGQTPRKCFYILGTAGSAQKILISTLY